MINANININAVLPRAIFDRDLLGDRLAAFLQATQEVVVEKYVDQSPSDSGDMSKGIKVKKRDDLEYIVESTARDEDDENYPLLLYMGTGRLKGMPDFGYTTGRVRANDVAWGIGGIRPNKAAKRAKDKAEPKVIRFINYQIKKELKKQRRERL